MWDRGTYRNITHDHDGQPVLLDSATTRGQISVWLEGDKLRGGFALVRFRGERLWLLVKMRDDHADNAFDPVVDRPESVLSGRSLEDLASTES